MYALLLQESVPSASGWAAGIARWVGNVTGYGVRSPGNTDLVQTSQVCKSPVPTPWRRELAALRDQLVRMIEENADPECQFQAAADISSDITYAVKNSLRKKYGRTFDRIIDGPEPQRSPS